MRTIRGLLKCWAAVLLGGLVMAAPASAASAFKTLFDAYKQSGAIASCKYSAAELQSAASQVPPDIQQYAPDFPAALQAALQARARGVCGGKGNGATAALPTTGGAAGAPQGPAPPTPAGVTPSPTRSADAGSSVIAAAAAAAPAGGRSTTGKVALIVLAVLMGALALGAVWWTTLVLRGREPAWAGPASHALGEARLRAGGALREFADWIRLGR